MHCYVTLSKYKACKNVYTLFTNKKLKAGQF